MQSLYPLKFRPVFKDKIWGGQKIKTVLNMDFGNLPNCGEAWLLSGVEGSPTLVENGYLSGNELNELVEVFMGDLVGDTIYERFGNEFPILVKVIDSNDWLSIQVHPDDELAQKRKIGYGKTEMWYLMQADPQAELISGFNQQVDESLYLEKLNSGHLKDIMNFEKVQTGDVYFMPAGRVHAIGPGCLIAEIQQTSDTTYRIYDWDRIDQAGMKRELHTEEALEAIDFTVHDQYKTAYQAEKNHTVSVIESPFFTTNFLQFDNPIRKDYSELDSFVILLCTEGGLTLSWQDEKIQLVTGEAVLVPKAIDLIELFPATKKAALLEVYIQA